MSDFRLFCWGTFIGLCGAAMLLEFGVARDPNAVCSPGEAVIALGLAHGCLVVISFGKRADRP